MGSIRLPSSAVDEETSTSGSVFQLVDDTTKMSEELPQCLRQFYDGRKDQTYPSKDLPHPPPWLNSRLFTRGQKFAQDHFYALAYSDIVSLIALFSLKDSLGPLIYTGNSSCVFSSFKRYVSTALRVLSWYEGDVFDPNSTAGKNILRVRNMHRLVVERLKATEPDVLAERTNIVRPLESLASVVRQDMNLVQGVDDEGHSVGTLPLNQWHSGITQFMFIGMVVTNPEKLGIVFYTEEDLEALVHLWAVLGYMIGIKDEYNLCIDGLSSFRERGKALRKACILPSLKNVDGQWEHMSRCMAQGTVAIYTPGFRSLYNTITRKGLSVAEKAEPNWIARVREKASLYHENFEYMK
ncbi:Hypothetical predicted protein [Cloeon dipterum]|uniref:ER-bound oxygenase mpaB/mpaB'/Rubber oxygenase catalytic domain-containing protein n=1 Tax=Cloeon dipterum TaxID=197152 RepID=A0A8S1CVI3_9INSE|nr:Hypothetical predicted protein [Cloeon dipterum]